MRYCGWAFILAAAVFCFASRAGAAAVDRPAEYVGDIDGTLRISVELRFAEDGRSASGRYFYFAHLQDIRLDAKIDGQHIVMREFDGEGNQTGQFVGEFSDSDPRLHYDSADKSPAEVIVGEWSRPDGSRKKPFYLLGGFRVLPAHTRGTYAVGGFDDDAAVDEFAGKFREAILRHDVETVTGMVKFPVSVELDSKVRELSRREFVRDYDRIFSPAYVDALAIASPVQMFARDQGVMLGDSGQIWIQPVGKEGKQTPAVVTINNGHRDQEINGHWRVSKVAGFANVSTMDDKQAAKWIGSQAFYSNDVARFTGPLGTAQCDDPSGSIHTVTEDEFFTEFRNSFADLGITGKTVTYFEISHYKEPSRWAEPGDTVIVKPNGTLIMCWEGVYFEMKRDDAADVAAAQ